MTATAAPAIRQATEADLDTIGAVLGAAFDTDPVFNWFVRNDELRSEAITRHVREVTRLAYLAHGETFVTEDGSGVLVCRPPGVPEPPPIPELERVFDWVTGPRGRARLNALGEIADAHTPTERRRYLFALGVKPGVQGKGIGAALLGHALARCDAEGEAAYLEASTERSARLYARLGFELRETLTLPDGPVLRAMWRDPR